MLLPTVNITVSIFETLEELLHRSFNTLRFAAICHIESVGPILDGKKQDDTTGKIRKMVACWKEKIINTVDDINDPDSHNTTSPKVSASDDEQPAIASSSSTTKKFARSLRLVTDFCISLVELLFSYAVMNSFLTSVASPMNHLVVIQHFFHGLLPLLLFGLLIPSMLSLIIIQSMELR